MEQGARSTPAMVLRRMKANSRAAVKVQMINSSKQT
jgi:hypothetical protein